MGWMSSSGYIFGINGSGGTGGDDSLVGAMDISEFSLSDVSFFESWLGDVHMTPLSNGHGSGGEIRSSPRALLN